MNRSQDQIFDTVRCYIIFTSGVRMLRNDNFHSLFFKKNIVCLFPKTVLGNLFIILRNSYLYFLIGIRILYLQFSGSSLIFRICISNLMKSVYISNLMQRTFVTFIKDLKSKASSSLVQQQLTALHSDWFTIEQGQGRIGAKWSKTI